VTAALVHGCRAQRGVEGDIVGPRACRPAANVAAAFAVGAGDAAATGVLARQLVQRRVKSLGLEGLADVDRLLLAFFLSRLVGLWNRVAGLGPGRTV